MYKEVFAREVFRPQTASDYSTARQQIQVILIKLMFFTQP